MIYLSKIICIDPGHGGYDPGSVGNGFRECDLNLAVSQTLRDILRDVWGVKVIMTRDSDKAPGKDLLSDLQARCAISDKAKVDLFLSIHVNSFIIAAYGAEAYAIPGGVAGSVAPNLVKAISPIMGVHGEPVKDGSSLYVLRKTIAPAILLELGYINSSDVYKIRDNIQPLAIALANVLGPFLGGIANQTKPIPAPTTLPSATVTQADLERAMASLRAEFKALLKG